MCGIAGVVNLNKSAPVREEQLKKLCESMAHRGPDEAGTFANGHVGLAHARLSIIDLSTGIQPVYNENKKVLVIFNGEIYNFLELKPELERQGHRFYTSSDTEVIVHLYEQYGTDCLRKLKGMFAFALYDTEQDLLLIARDRLGEKPLKYYLDDEKLIFASELKSILAIEDVDRAIDPDALSAYFSLLCVPAPLTIFQKIKKLEPGTCGILKDGHFTVKRYWNVEYREGGRRTEEEYLEEIDRQLGEAVRSCMIADVPIGVFLSGGIDSSLVTSYLAELSDRPVKTFSVGFGKYINELPYAQQVAELYKTDHTVLQVDPDVRDIIEDIVWYFEEPFADSSAVPTYIMSREARKQVKVILTGDGGDELFAGYESYALLNRHKLRLAFRGTPLRYLFSLADLLERKLGRDISGIFNLVPLSSKNNYFDYYKIKEYFDEEEKGKLLKPPVGSATFDLLSPGLDGTIAGRDRPFYFDLKYYLPDDLLVKVDMASMANSLETRAPFLDFELVTTAFSIPVDLKMKGGVKKYLLKKVAEKRLPPAIVHRKKQGFGAPVDEWLRSDLRDMVIARLKDRDHIMYRWLNHDYVLTLVDDFYERGRPGGYRVWIVFMFALWCEKYMSY